MSPLIKIVCLHRMLLDESLVSLLTECLCLHHMLRDESFVPLTTCVTVGTFSVPVSHVS